jgi:hypothetical protein
LQRMMNPKLLTVRRSCSALVIVACVILFGLCGSTLAFVTFVRDQAIFVGTDQVQVSLVKHSDEFNYDLVGSKPSIYLGAKPPNCKLAGDSDVIFAFTGAWLATWKCEP